MAAEIPFEIIVFDDGSGSSLNLQNELINKMEHGTFRSLLENIGRSKIRNLLAKEAKYDWLLFLDADTMPVNNELVTKYIPSINNETKIVYGGILYQPNPPVKSMLLRWVYGNGRESVPAEERSKLPHLKLLTLNFMAKKSVFDKVKFNESVPNMRHEDTLFSYDLKKQGIFVEHIDNPVYHLGLEDSGIFIRKEEQSAEVLTYMVNAKLIPYDYVRVSKIQYFIKKTGLTIAAKLAFKIFKKSFIRNLTGNNPSLLVFDLYRLGYICSLKPEDIPTK